MSTQISPERQTYYQISGEGEPLIFIHGVGLDHTMWGSQIEYFSTHYQVIVFDMLGHGSSQKLNRKAPYTLADFAEQLRQLFTELKIDRAHLVGFSMGGLVAQYFTIYFPNKVKSLTIANSVANRTEEESAAILSRVKLVEENGKNATIDAALERWFTKKYFVENPSLIEKIRRRLQQNDETSYLHAYRVFATGDKELWNRLENIETPTFIITGENDIGSNPRMAYEMHEKIAHSQVCIVPGARHMLPVERPGIFNQHVHDFLKGVNND